MDYIANKTSALPYYLHIDVSEKTAKKIVKLMQAQLPGYLVPRLAKEEKGEKSKTILL